MDKKFYVAVTYDLRVGDEDELMEQATLERPLCFYSGVGMMLDRFEAEILPLQVNDSFDFVIPCAEAYGEYDDAGLIDIEREKFEKDGQLAEEIQEGNTIVLLDNEQHRVNASVVSIGDKTVQVDLNHPLAGENLHFTGKVIVKREADEEELKQLFSCQHNCGGHCGDCGSECGGACGGDCTGGCD